MESFRREDDRYFRTPNLHLAGVLLSRGFPLVNLDRSDAAKCQFVFRNSYDLEAMAERFSSGKPVYVEAAKFLFCWKMLRSKINEDRF